MREKKILDLFDKLKKLDDNQLKLMDTAANSFIVVQKLTELSTNESMNNLAALLG